MSTTTTLVLDHVGLLASNDGIVFYLTSCCEASVKGSSNSPTGACCRSCYKAVAPELGAAWLATDADAWDNWLLTWHASEDHKGVDNARLIDQMAAMVRTA